MPLSHETLSATLEAAHRTQWSSGVEVLSRAPGRVNVLGGHVDYSEGFVLPGAIEQSVWIAASRSPVPGRVRVLATDLGETGEFDVGQLPPAVPDREGGATWLDYFIGPAATFLASDADPGIIDTPDFGLDLTLSSDLPMGIGVSSSAALTVAQLQLWDHFAHDHTGGQPAEAERRPDRLRIARLARRFENDWLGVQCGLMDPYASLFGRPSEVLLLDCRSETHEPIPFPESLAILVADTGVQRRLTDSGFNSRRDECLEACRLLRSRWPRLRTLRDLAPDQLEEAEELLPEPLDRRARHVVTECRRVLDGARALRDSRLEDFGAAINASYDSSRDDYQVTIPELDTLAHSARRAEGCLGARVSGAGFGGGIVAIVRRDAVEGVAERLMSDYRAAYGFDPRIEPVCIADGAQLWVS